MGRGYKIRDQSKLYFVTFSVIHWIDVFTRVKYKDLLIESLKYCQEHKSLEIYAYVVMSNHLHLIIGQSSDKKIQDIIRDFKKYTSYSIMEAIKNNPKESRKGWIVWMMERAGKANSNNKNHQFWQQHSHPIELNTNRLMEQKLEYIHHNPVKAGIVLSPQEYLYSSAKNYYGMNDECLLDVIFIQ